MQTKVGYIRRMIFPTKKCMITFSYNSSRQFKVTSWKRFANCNWKALFKSADTFSAVFYKKPYSISRPSSSIIHSFLMQRENDNKRYLPRFAPSAPNQISCQSKLFSSLNWQIRINFLTSQFNQHICNPITYFSKTFLFSSQRKKKSFSKKKTASDKSMFFSANRKKEREKKPLIMAHPVQLISCQFRTTKVESCFDVQTV